MHNSISLMSLLLGLVSGVEINAGAGNNSKFVEEGMEKGFLGKGLNDKLVITSAGEKLARNAADAMRNHGCC